MTSKRYESHSHPVTEISTGRKKTIKKQKKHRESSFGTRTLDFLKMAIAHENINPELQCQLIGSQFCKIKPHVSHVLHRRIFPFFFFLNNSAPLNRTCLAHTLIFNPDEISSINCMIYSKPSVESYTFLSCIKWLYYPELHTLDHIKNGNEW